MKIGVVDRGIITTSNMTEDEYYAHLDMVKYFWAEYKDPTKYYAWKNIKSEIKKRNPEIIRAWKRYKEAKQILNNLL